MLSANDNTECKVDVIDENIGLGKKKITDLKYIIAIELLISHLYLMYLLSYGCSQLGC